MLQAIISEQKQRGEPRDNVLAVEQSLADRVRVFLRVSVTMVRAVSTLFLVSTRYWRRVYCVDILP